MLDPISTATIVNEAATGTCYQRAMSIFAPMKASTIARPYFSRCKRLATSASTKYSAPHRCFTGSSRS